MNAAQLIKKMRKESPYTQAWLCTFIPCKQQTLSAYERGDIAVSVEVLEIIARTTGHAISYCVRNGWTCLKGEGYKG